MDAVSDRRIVGEGTPEAVWDAFGLLASCATLDPSVLVPADARAVVVAPHPDDEVLAAGGLLATLAGLGREVMLVGVTDGEACFAAADASTREALRRRRRLESAEGCRRLGLQGHREQRFEVADGGVAAQVDSLTDRLADELRERDVVFGTWRLDGHPDHEAVGRASAEACRRVGCRLIEMPVWMWHWSVPGDPRVPWARLRAVPLSPEAFTRKTAALEAHVSQLRPGPHGEAPILPNWALARLTRRREFFFASLSDEVGP